MLRRREVLGLGGSAAALHFGARAFAQTGRTAEIAIFHYQESERAEAFREIAARFERENPAIKVNSIFKSAGTIQADMQAALAARLPLDLGTVVGGRVRAFMKSLPVVPINADPAQSKFLARILPNFLDAGRKGEQLFAVPYALGTPLLYVNRTMFRQAKLDADQLPATMNDVIAAGRAVQERTGAAGFGHVTGIDYKFFGTALMARNAGGRYLNDEGDHVVLDSTDAVKGLQLWQDLVVKHKITPIVSNDAAWRTAFLSGKLAQYVDSSALLSEVAKGATFELATAQYPLFPGRAERHVINSGALFMMFSPPGPRREAALKFLDFITRPDIQGFWSRATGYMPVVPDAQMEPVTALAAPMIAQMKETRAIDGWTSPKNPVAASIIGTLIDDLWAGKASAAELVPDAVHRANAALA